MTVCFVPVVFLEEEASSGKEFIFISSKQYTEVERELSIQSFGYRIVDRGDLGIKECFSILTEHFKRSLSICYLKVISRVGTTMVVADIEGGENIVVMNNGSIRPAPTH